MWEGVHPAAIIGFAILLAAVGSSLLFGRMLLLVAVRSIKRKPRVSYRGVILGSRERAEYLRGAERLDSESRLDIVGYLTADRHHDGDALGGLPDLVWIIERHNIDTIVIDGQFDDDAVVDVLDVADRLGCTVLAGSPALPTSGFVPQVMYRHHVPYVRMVRPKLRWAQLISKRTFDIVVASTLLVLLSPVLVIIALLIKMTSHGPVLFTSLRVGYAGKRFAMYKFRSMVQNAEDLRSLLNDQSVYNDPRVFKVMNDPRVTALGRFLRRSSLDELPQLWNVLRGEMSLVGPRPPLVREVAAYEENNYSRFDMKPGITGPWQVSGRSGITSFDRIIALETAYLTDWSLSRDLSILLRTIPAVLSMRGAV